MSIAIAYTTAYAICTAYAVGIAQIPTNQQIVDWLVGVLKVGGLLLLSYTAFTVVHLFITIVLTLRCADKLKQNGFDAAAKYLEDNL